MTQAAETPNDCGEDRAPASPRFDEQFQTRLLDLFAWRRDVRHFRDESVPVPILEALMRTAALAPSVGLSEPWRFVLVDDRARRKAVRENFEACNAHALGAVEGERSALYARLKLAGIDEAPTQFAVFCDPGPTRGGGLGRRSMPNTPLYSTVMAIHTLWLAARARGIGLGWVSILEPETISAILDVPAEWVFIGYFCLGFPKEDHLVPELERLGWEQRRPGGAELLRR